MLHIQWKKARKSLTILTLGILLASCCTPAYSQTDLNQYDHDSKPYYFGITLGINSARFHTDMHPRFLQNDSVLVAEPVKAGGFALGLAATKRLSDRFEARLNPQLIFTERQLYYKLKYPDPDLGTDVTKLIESVLVSFPVQIKFNSDRIGNFRVYMLGGVKGDIDLASNARAKKAEDLVKINKYDFGVEAGIGFNFYFPSFIFSPEIKFSNGLSNLHSRDETLKYSSVLDKIQSRMIVFSIHLEG
ncbi:MAG TPA: porin family protein [Chitinophagaceae bacterium]|nr:porin family protein [Chitinophagaceae bacterium]